MRCYHRIKIVSVRYKMLSYEKSLLEGKREEKRGWVKKQEFNRKRIDR